MGGSSEEVMNRSEDRIEQEALLIQLDKSRAELPPGKCTDHFVVAINYLIDIRPFRWIILDHIVHQGFNELNSSS